MMQLAEAVKPNIETTKRDLFLVYDTETSALKNPYLVQLACSLIDGDGKEHGGFHCIVRPDGWEIPDEAAAIHGITTAMAHEVGLPVRVAVAAFLQMRAVVCATVAHNIKFDNMVIETELKRLGITPAKAAPRNLCTMESSIELVGLPPTERQIKAGFRNKAPKLIELHQFLFGVGFDKAHSATADVAACAKCFVELRKRMVLL